MGKIIRINENDIRRLVISVLNEASGNQTNGDMKTMKYLSAGTFKIAEYWSDAFFKKLETDPNTREGRLIEKEEENLFAKLVLKLSNDKLIYFIAYRAIAANNAKSRKGHNDKNQSNQSSGFENYDQLNLGGAVTPSSLFLDFIYTDHSDLFGKKTDDNSIIRVHGDDFKEILAGAVSNGVSEFYRCLNNYFRVYCNRYWERNKKPKVEGDTELVNCVSRRDEIPMYNILDKIIDDSSFVGSNRMDTKLHKIASSHNVPGTVNFSREVLYYMMEAVKEMSNENIDIDKTARGTIANKVKRLAYQMYINNTDNPISEKTFMTYANRMTQDDGPLPKLIKIYRNMIDDERSKYVYETKQRKKLNKIINEVIRRLFGNL